MLLMLSAVAMFAGMDASMKQLAAHYPPLEVGALRGAASLPFVVAWAVGSRGWRSLRPVRWGLHLLRGALGVAMMAGFVYGIARLPLSTAYALTFVAPVLVTALAVPLLGERVGPRRWIAVAAGLAGVLVVLRPGASAVSLPGLAILAAAACYAASAVTVRILVRTDTTQAAVVWVLLVMAGGAALLAWPAWVPLRAQDVGLFALVGLFGAFGQVLLTEAFRVGEASQVAPLEYSALLWSILLDALVWRILPGPATWLGAGIIIGSGLYLLRRQSTPMASPPP